MISPPSALIRARAALHRFHGLPINQRTHQRLVVHRIADANVTVGGLQFARHFLRDSALQKEAPDAGAALAGRAHRAKQHRAQGQIEIGIVHYDDAVVAAQFEQSAAQPPSHGFGNDAAHASGTGGADQWNPRDPRPVACRWWRPRR